MSIHTASPVEIILFPNKKMLASFVLFSFTFITLRPSTSFENSTCGDTVVAEKFMLTN